MFFLTAVFFCLFSAFVIIAWQTRLADVADKEIFEKNEKQRLLKSCKRVGVNLK